MADGEYDENCEEYDHEKELILPQPRSEKEPLYRYILYDDIEPIYYSSRLRPGTLCWVLLSKGKKGGKSTTVQRCAELFIRARVVQDDDGEPNSPSLAARRILIRYPKGSTYRVKRQNLIPVLSTDEKLVVVYAETPNYRKGCVVHTCIGDSFLEIGCDYGPTVDRVQGALLEVTSVPEDPVDGPVMVPELLEGKVHCLGIDKSQQSIDIAVERFPNCAFSVEDALTEKGVYKLRDLCREKFQQGYPSIVAIDINGNRSVPAVLECIANVMNPNDDDPTWQLPRRIFVKSRYLYNIIKRDR